MTNTPSGLSNVSDLLQAISPEVRLEILLAIGSGEACVCHLETALGYRQAHISQNLMALREAGLLTTRRDGKYIFYRLERPEIMEMVGLAVRLAGFDASVVADRINQARSTCDCPNCSTQKEIHVGA
jgi:ArsR family transcriptional regulator, arsenate/arsenite/antimonite-responsive transcriptional repressor